MMVAQLEEKAGRHGQRRTCNTYECEKSAILSVLTAFM